MTGASEEDVDTTCSPVLSTSSGNVRINNMTIPNGSVSTLSDKVSGYEEFSGMICPTCNGTGRIPRGQEDELVALIPYSDGRLKPRRTWLWVGLSIFGCVVVAGILCFVLIPREIKIGDPGAETYGADLNKTKKHLLIELNFMFNVTNNNYVPVTVNEVDIQAEIQDDVVVSKTQYMLHAKVNSKKTQMITIPLNVSIDATGKKSYIMTICDPHSRVPYPHLLYLTFYVTMHTHLLAQDKENSLSTYPIHVSCVPPSHI